MNWVDEEIDDLEYKATLTGEVNKQPIAVIGEGIICSEEGLTKGGYDLELLPEGFSPLFLSTVLITGYPNACASLDGSPNLFKGMSYHYEREISFCDGGHLSLKTECDVQGRSLISKFFLSGEIEPADLCGVEPLVEAWESISDQEIQGSFKIVWRRHNGSLLSAEARSRYHIHRKSRIAPLIHRFIRIEPQVENGRLFLTQKSFIFQQLSCG